MFLSTYDPFSKYLLYMDCVPGIMLSRGDRNKQTKILYSTNIDGLPFFFFVVPVFKINPVGGNVDN